MNRGMTVCGKVADLSYDFAWQERMHLTLPNTDVYTNDALKG